MIYATFRYSKVYLFDRKREVVENESSLGKKSSYFHKKMSKQLKISNDNFK
jgi:hypothetical protein